MAMKRTELEKLKGKTIESRMRAEQRRRQAASVKGQRRKQRERDRALGLVPFEVELDAALVAEIRSAAVRRGGDFDTVTVELPRGGLDAARDAA